jgi:hypothetical protein
MVSKSFPVEIAKISRYRLILTLYSRSIDRCSRTCARLILEVALQLVRFQVIRQGSLNIPRFNMMYLDQVGVIAIRNPNQFGKTNGRARMQPVSEPFGRHYQIRNQIGHVDRNVFKQARLYSVKRFNGGRNADPEI